MFNLFRARKGLTKGIFWALILVMGAGMVVFFVPSADRSLRFQGGSEDVVATVGDIPITGKELRKVLESQRRQFSQYNPGGDLSFLKQLNLERRALDQLIQDHLVEAEATRLGITVSPDEVADTISKNPSFMLNGQFIGRSAYLRLLQANDYTPAEFENSIRRGLLQEKLQGFVSDGVTVSVDEVRQEWLTRNEKATIDYVVIDPKTAEDAITVTEAELQDYFNKHQEQYKGTEERKVKYLFIDQESLRKSITVSEQELRDAFQKNPGETEVRVSHILFKTENKSEEELEPIRKKAEDVLMQARSGGDFAALAKQYSQDDTSAQNGGEMAFATRQTFVPEFSDVAFNKLTKPGEIYDGLVKTQYGYHIIKLLERKEPNFETRKAQLEMTVKSAKVQDETRKLADRVDNSLRQSKDLNKTAQEFNLTVGESSPFKSNASIVTPIKGSARAMVTKVFQLKNIGEMTSPAVKTSGGYIVAQLTEIKPPAIPPFAEVQTRVQADYKKAKAEEQVNAKAAEFAKALETSKDIQTTAKQNGLEVHTSNEFKKNDQIDSTLNYAPEVAEKAFTLKVGEPSGVVTIASGNKKVIFVLKSKPELDNQQFEKDKASLREELAGNKRRTFFMAYVNSLKDKMEKDKKIHVNQEVFKRYSL